MMKVDLKLQGMTCLDCARHIEKALKQVPGVRQAKVEYRAARGTVELAQEVSESDLIRHCC